MAHPLSRLFLVALLFLLNLSCICHAADPAHKPNELDSIAREMRRKRHGSTASDDRLLLSGKWLIAGSNFSKLFTQPGGVSNLLDWSLALTPGFAPQGTSTERNKELVFADEQFRDEQRTDFYVRILVPHPKYAEMADLFILPQFAEQSPPKLKVLEMKEITVRGRKAMLYVHREGDCSILVKVARSATVRLYTKSHQNAKQLETLAGMIDYDRLSNKLNS